MGAVVLGGHAQRPAGTSMRMCAQKVGPCSLARCAERLTATTDPVRIQPTWELQHWQTRRHLKQRAMLNGRCQQNHALTTSMRHALSAGISMGMNAWRQQRTVLAVAGSL